ncbi:hypothetical protein RSAG8_08853, partial [Rhizoctonia solani AG-8 WAC10335]
MLQSHRDAPRVRSPFPIVAAVERHHMDGQLVIRPIARTVFGACVGEQGDTRMQGTPLL